MAAVAETNVLTQLPIYSIAEPHKNRRLKWFGNKESPDKVTEIPYDRTAYGNITVNPHNFDYRHQPKSCDLTHSVLVTAHSAVNVSNLVTS